MYIRLVALILQPRNRLHSGISGIVNGLSLQDSITSSELFSAKSYKMKPLRKCDLMFRCSQLLPRITSLL